MAEQAQSVLTQITGEDILHLRSPELHESSEVLSRLVQPAFITGEYYSRLLDCLGAGTMKP